MHIWSYMHMFVGMGMLNAPSTKIGLGTWNFAMAMGRSWRHNIIKIDSYMSWHTHLHNYIYVCVLTPYNQKRKTHFGEICFLFLLFLHEFLCIYICISTRIRDVCISLQVKSLMPQCNAWNRRNHGMSIQIWSPMVPKHPMMSIAMKPLLWSPFGTFLMICAKAWGEFRIADVSLPDLRKLQNMIQK